MPLRRYGAVLALAVIYFGAGYLGLRLGIVHPSVSAVWAPTGIALAALLIFGLELWPGVLLGAFAVNLVVSGAPFSSAGIAIGNTLEAVVGARLIAQWAGGREAMASGQGVVRFALLGALGATSVSATIGVSSLALAGQAPWSLFPPMWLTWWLGDAAGALLVTPPLLLWWARPRPGWAPARAVELALLLVMLAGATGVAFGRVLPGVPSGLELGFICLPPLIAVTVRFGAREAASALVLTALVAVLATNRALGGASPAERNQTLILLQTFMAVTAVTIQMLAAALGEQRAVRARLHALATTDSLTGLGNYRRLITALEQELVRAQRSGREFAILFLDLDGLKGINDRHGHLVGSRALVRLAEAIRDTARAVDLPARYGGDEFAIVMPESAEAQAAQLAGRIALRLAADTEVPPVRASVGVAVCPRDGTTVEQLLARADRALYAQKLEGSSAVTRARAMES